MTSFFKMHNEVRKSLFSAQKMLEQKLKEGCFTRKEGDDKNGTIMLLILFIKRITVSPFYWQRKRQWISFSPAHVFFASCTKISNVTPTALAWTWTSQLAQNTKETFAVNLRQGDTKKIWTLLKQESLIFYLALQVTPTYVCSTMEWESIHISHSYRVARVMLE